MMRRFWTVLSGLSLLLCLATAGLWVRSIDRGDKAVFSVGDVLIYGYARDGRFGIGIDSRFPEKQRLCLNRDDPKTADLVGWPVLDVDRSAKWHWLGLSGDYGTEYPLLNERGHIAHWNAMGLSDTSESNRKGKLMRFWDIDDARFLPLVIVLMVPPLGWVVWHKWSRRRLVGQCVRCGYDLRATPGCCPECGTVPASDVHVRHR